MSRPRGESERDMQTQDPDEVSRRGAAQRRRELELETTPGTSAHAGERRTAEDIQGTDGVFLPAKQRARRRELPAVEPRGYAGTPRIHACLSNCPRCQGSRERNNNKFQCR